MSLFMSNGNSNNVYHAVVQSVKMIFVYHNKLLYIVVYQPSVYKPN